MQDNHFSTSDFYLAAYCVAQGMKIAGISRSGSGKATFLLEGAPKGRELMKEFLFSDPNVEAKRFVSAIKELKQLLYSVA
ncbi:MAG: hypothetical protein IPJ68_00735 [Candidatus Moraniibacteriota bacterium]|nr:MAG: hypothetical protein IPJ68_00735 [Candidatus Moranbacteria bacterium]